MPGGSQEFDGLIALIGASSAGTPASAQVLRVMAASLTELTKRLRGEAKGRFGALTRTDIQRHVREVQGNLAKCHHGRTDLEEPGDERCSDAVPDGVRNSDESDCVASIPARTSQAFWLLAAMKSAETRFARVTRRNGEGEPNEFEHIRTDDRRAMGDFKSAFQTNAFLIAEAFRRFEHSGGPGDQEDALAGSSRQCVATAELEPGASPLRGEPKAGQLAGVQYWTRGRVQSWLSLRHA